MRGADPGQGFRGLGVQGLNGLAPACGLKLVVQGYKPKSGEGSITLAAMLCVRHLSGRELVTATQDEVAALADAHGSVTLGIEQLLSPLVGQPCFRLKLICGHTQLTPDTSLKLPLELQVAVCDYVAVEAVDVDEFTDASQKNDTAAVEAFLRRPLNPDSVDSDGLTALLAAAGSGALQSVKLLASGCADLNKPREPSGATPVFLAAQTGHLAVVDWLIENGADKDRANNTGATPVYVASQNGKLDVVRLLIEKGAGKDTATDTGATPVYIASQQGRLDIVRLLIEKGAGKDIAINDGSTPVIIASAVMWCAG